MICEVAADTFPKRIHRIGMRGFAESGDWKALLKEYKLDDAGVAEQIVDGLNKGKTSSNF